MFFRWPDLKPSPSPTSISSDPTPQAMPNMVKNDRSLWAHNVRITWAKMSKAILISVSRVTPAPSPVLLLSNTQPKRLRFQYLDGNQQLGVSRVRVFAWPDFVVAG